MGGAMRNRNYYCSAEIEQSFSKPVNIGMNQFMPQFIEVKKTIIIDAEMKRYSMKMDYI